MSAAKVAVIAGYGVGISHGVAKHFGRQGYAVALLSRTASKVEAASAGEH
jgi:NADP-dependent 3-hydroxy acid dehydrogenase YdfG